jgi:hypothetical protein
MFTTVPRGDSRPRLSGGAIFNFTLRMQPRIFCDLAVMTDLHISLHDDDVFHVEH